jgi:Ca2+-binding EF-hand superfamily protein
MKLPITLLLAIAGLVAVPGVHAQENGGRPGGGGGGGRGPGGPGGRLPEDVIKKYDKDGDGKLNDEERKAFREDRDKEMLAKYDVNKDGKLDDEETKKMRAENPPFGRGGFGPDAEAIKKYDKDADGKLNDEEMKAWRDARQKENLEKYDADKDGKLSEEERRKMFDDLRKQRENRAAEPVKPVTPEVKSEAKAEAK